MRVNGKEEAIVLRRGRDILRQANSQGYVVLEDEAKEDPDTTVPPVLKKMQPLLRG